MTDFKDFAWEDNDDVRLYRASYMACAYNAAVNHGTPRGLRKMGDLVRAINEFERIEGKVKLELLVSYGVIESFNPCPQECHMRPGGLFHAKDCENDSNHPVSKARTAKATEVLPGGRGGGAGWRAAYVSLVG